MKKKYIYRMVAKIETCQDCPGLENCEYKQEVQNDNFCECCPYCRPEKQLIENIFFVQDDFKVEHYQLMNKELADWLVYKEKRDDGKTSLLTFTDDELMECLDEKTKFFISKDEAFLKLVDNMVKTIEIQDNIIDKLLKKLSKTPHRIIYE